MFLQGCITALATPFDAIGVDEKTFAGFVEWQISEGADGLVPCGTTGEGPTLTSRERERLIRISVECASGRVPVIAGTGTNCTATTIEQTRAAKESGADAALIVTPYYNKPTQEGLYRHYAAVARAVDIPIVLYNVPARTGIDLQVSTIECLAKIPAIVGIKDATGDAERPRAVALAAGRAFVQLCGDDASAVTFDFAGGRGCISVVSNVAPALCAELQHACRVKDWMRARVLQDRLQPLMAALGRETNPGPIKHALSVIRPGFSQQLRLPLVPASASTMREIKTALLNLHLVAPAACGRAAETVAPSATVDHFGSQEGGASDSCLSPVVRVS